MISDYRAISSVLRSLDLPARPDQDIADAKKDIDALDDKLNQLLSELAVVQTAREFLSVLRGQIYAEIASHNSPMRAIEAKYPFETVIHKICDDHIPLVDKIDKLKGQFTLDNILHMNCVATLVCSRAIARTAAKPNTIWKVNQPPDLS